MFKTKLFLNTSIICTTSLVLSSSYIACLFIQRHGWTRISKETRSWVFHKSASACMLSKIRRPCKPCNIFTTAITNSKQKFHRGLPLSHSFKYMYTLSICKQFITSNIFHVHSLYMYIIFLPVFHRYKRRTTAAFLHINVTHILITIKTVL